MKTTPDAGAVLAAAERLRGGIIRTPTDRSRVLSNLIGGDVFLKIESRQVTGAFKERGALNALLGLDTAARARGVVTMSGRQPRARPRLSRHAAWGSARSSSCRRGRRSSRCAGRGDYGAEVVLHGETFEESSAYARELAAETGATLIHPYDDLAVIAGQGTATLELLARRPRSRGAAGPDRRRRTHRGRGARHRGGGCERRTDRRPERVVSRRSTPRSTISRSRSAT